MVKKPLVSIIIVKYKVREKLIECIESIEKYAPKISYEVIVVDNEGDQNLQTQLIAFKNATYIKSKSNLGFGAGNNLGASKARGEYLFFLNPDTLFVENVVDGLYKLIKSDNEIGIVAPKLLDLKRIEYPEQGTVELTPFKALLHLSFLSKFFKKSHYFIYGWNSSGLREVSVCPGTAFIISKKLFEKVGGFDEKFFLYFEEFDFCKRVKELGYKIFIASKFKIIHEWGVSTKKLENRDQIFAKSRFYYFKKHFGLIKALSIESILRINKFSFLVLLALGIALFLRLFNLSQSMPFIGDQGWFYLSARDMLLTGKIPLVGITSSHIWLHQGPLWTYMLAVILKLFNFNPISGAYLTAIFGTATVFLIYFFGSQMFSKKVGLIACFLYAVSPLVIFFDRMPYHTSLIPFFTLLYFFAFYKWLSGKAKYFPLVLVFMAILYNFELATFTLFFPFALMFAYGSFKKKKWVTELANSKIIFSSIVFPVIIMLPVIIYDFSHGFKQTIVFFGWILYKPFSFLIKHQGSNFSSSLPSVINFLGLNLRKLVFDSSLIIAILIFIFSIILVAVSIKKVYSLSKMLLLFLLVILLGGILINSTPSDAYLPVIFPFVIFSLGILFDWLLKSKYLWFAAGVLLMIIFVLNFYSSFIQAKNFKELGGRMVIVNKIIALSHGREYNLVGEGLGSKFSSFTMNYEYLLWWKGYPPAKQTVNLKFIVSESPRGFAVREK